MDAHAEGVEVHVQLPSQQQQQETAKAPATLSSNTQADSATNSNAAISTAPNSTAMDSPDLCWSSTCLWTLFVLGWLFPPLWWAGAAAGLKTGQDRQCLIVRRKGLSPKQVAPWRACALMSLLSAVVLIVVLASYYGQLSPAHEGPFYLTLAGPSDAFPDLSTPSNKLLITTAVHSALNLGSSYPVSNILLWVQQQTVTASTSSYPTPTKRRLSEAATTKIFVLGYSLAKTPELPSKMQLAIIMASAEGTERLADKLADLEFLPAEDLGRLSVGLVSWGDSNQVVQHLTENLGQSSAFHLAPIGKKDCQGSWSAWSACVPFDAAAQCGSGNMTRTFTVSTPARAGGRPCVAEHGAVEVQACNMTTPCNATCTCSSGPEVIAYTALPGSDLPGFDIPAGSVPRQTEPPTAGCERNLSSVDECAQLCADTPFCQAFTYQSSGACTGGCWVKKAHPQGLWSVVSDDTTVNFTSGVMPVVVANTEMLVDQDYGGADFALHNCVDFNLGNGPDLTPMSAELCSATCATTPICRAYSFIASPSRPGCPFGCYLKHSIPNLLSNVDSAGVITGTVNGTKATYAHLVKTDFANSTDIPSPDACALDATSTLEQCAGLCAKTPDCMAFVYAPSSPAVDACNTSCTLKSSAEGRVARNCVAAGVLFPTGSIGHKVNCSAGSKWNSTAAVCQPDCGCPEPAASSGINATNSSATVGTCSGQPAATPGVMAWACNEAAVGGTCEATCSGRFSTMHVYNGTAVAECEPPTPDEREAAWNVTTDCDEVVDYNLPQ